MQVEVLPAAPLPGGVKVARRSVKPFVLVRVQVWQPISGCNVSSRRAFARGHPPRNEEDAGASPAALTISGRQADTSWLHLSRKQDRLKPEVGALPTPSAISRFACSGQSRSKLANAQASKTQGLTSMRARIV